VIRHFNSNDMQDFGGGLKIRRHLSPRLKRQTFGGCARARSATLDCLFENV
jgi:hypothetical protein